MKWISDHTSYRITVGVVDSPSSRSAVSWAAREAARRGYSLLLVHVDSPSDDGSYQSRGPATMLMNELVDLAEDQTPMLKVRTTILTGRVSATLLDLSRRADMLVVGCDIEPHQAHNRIDSVTAALMRHAACPVAIVRPADSTCAILPRGVVIATDPLTPREVLGFAFDEAVTHAESLTIVENSDGTSGRRESSTGNAYGGSRVEYASLAQRLTEWRTRYPTVAVHIEKLGLIENLDLIENLGVSAQLTIVEANGGSDQFERSLDRLAEQVVLRARSTVIVIPLSR